MYLLKKEGKFYDYRDVAVKFTRNLPTDMVGLADVIAKIKDICSQETLLTLLPFVENPKVELQKYDAEQLKLKSQSSEDESAIQNQIIV